MNILIANDHGGLDLKRQLETYLRLKGHGVVNRGVDIEEQVDYPDIGEKTCREFLENGTYDFGILICGTGIGISMTANKVAGIRCALVHDHYTAKMAKSHNNANFIALGGRITYSSPVVDIVQTFIDTTVLGGRHTKRLKKLEQIELKTKI